MLASWLDLIGDQWQYCEPPVCLGPTWGEMVDASTHFSEPYDLALKCDSLHNLGPLGKGEVQGDDSMHKVAGKKHEFRRATPGAAIRGYTKGNYRTVCCTVNNGADCDALADELEHSFPGIKQGQIQNVMCNVNASFNGFCKPIGARGVWRGALRPGESHGKDKKWDDSECLRAQLQGAIRLAKVMSMFRWACFSCAGTGEIWEIDCNKNLANFDGGAQWNIWTAMALQAMQAQGIPVLPCVKILGSIKHLKRDKYHFSKILTFTTPWLVSSKRLNISLRYMAQSRRLPTAA